MMLLLAALLVASDPAVAAQQPVAAVPAAAPAPAAKPAKPKLICKSLDADTGTHMSNRVCKTKEEWAVFDQSDDMRDLDTMGARTH